MHTTNESNLIIKVIEYALSNDTFAYEQLRKDLNLKADDGSDGYVYNALTSFEPKNAGPNHIIGLTMIEWHKESTHVDYMKSKYRLLPSAYFSYIDMQEIQLARENAEFAKANAIEANKKSMIAIWISAAAMVASVIIGGIQIYLALPN